MVKQPFTMNNLLLSSVKALTLADRRLYNYLLLHCFDQLSDKVDFVIKLADLAGIYGTGLPPIERLKESLRRLLNTLIEFETGEKKWQVIALLKMAELDVAKAQLSYTYSRHCQQLLLNPVTLEKCLIQAHFTKKYSNILYEVLAPVAYTKQGMLSVAIDDLRSALQVSDHKLTNYSDFDRFVLIPAVQEINSYASFAVNYQTQRKGMKVTQVIFKVTLKKPLLAFASAKEVIPPKRPRLFIDNPAVEHAYAYLLNAETQVRRKFFDAACKLAAKKQQPIAEEDFDRPDIWFQWVEKNLLKILNYSG